ncbi:phosphatase [Candidatus Nitromaritima sp. SCGC AAA799-C22]|nr:phosphatase [Candidatus Nitromaritima sp. SCGC AAA799-C22]
MSPPDTTSQAATLNSILTKTQGIIFDFDGLLADSEPFHYRAYNEVFERYGHSLDPDEYWVEWTSKGKGIAGEIERHNLNLGIDPVELRQQKFEVYSRFCQSGAIKLFPEALRIVEFLKTDHQLAIASGSWKRDIQAILKHAGVDQQFLHILGKESAPREKPHPDIFLNAAEAIECKTSECLVIEDALKGLAAAKSAGISCIIIKNPLNQNIDFKEANLIIPSLSEFASLLEI